MKEEEKGKGGGRGEEGESLTGHKDEAVLIGKKLAEEVREAFKNEKG